MPKANTENQDWQIRVLDMPKQNIVKIKILAATMGCNIGDLICQWILDGLAKAGKHK